MSRELRERREKDWFWIDNALIDRTDLNLYEKMLYICLARHTGGKDYAFPSLETLCKELGIKDKRTVVKYIDNLIEKGLVEAEKARGKVNVYYLYNVRLDTSNVPSLDKKYTQKVPTSDDTSNISCKKVGTFNAESSSMKCTSKKINNNININTTSSSAKFLKEKGISDGTIKNILKLNREFSVEYLEQVIEYIREKNMGEGALVTAITENWNIPKNKIQVEIDNKHQKALKKIKGSYDYYLSAYLEGIYSASKVVEVFCKECEQYQQLEIFNVYKNMLKEKVQ